MEAVFLKLLNMSIAAGWLVLAVIILRMVLKKAPKWITGILWAFVSIRLICPFSFESMFSLIPSAEVLPKEILLTDTPSIESGIPVLDRTINPVLGETLSPNIGDSANPMQILIFLFSVVWIIGIVVMLIYALVSFLRIKQRVAEAIPLKDNIWICDYVSTPFILGIFQPRIFLPSSMNEQDMDYVILHENAHLQRRDHLWKPLGFLLLTIYWFHPVLWIAYVLFCRDIELACDEKVIKELESDTKKAYSYALINCSAPRRTITACPLAFGETGVKKRVKNILHYKKPAFWIVIVSLLACIIAAICLLTNPLGRTIDDQLLVFLDTQIYEHHRSEYTDEHFVCVDYKILKADVKPHKATIYMWVLFEEFTYDGELKIESGAHVPTVITARKADYSYELEEYWEPRDGSYYADDIRDKFPTYLWYQALNGENYIDEQKADCLKNAEEYYESSIPNAGGVYGPLDVSYKYTYSKDSRWAYLSLEPKTKKSTFCYSPLSSYLPSGTYEETDEYITMKTDDGKYTYTFLKSGNDLIFVKTMSSYIPGFRYSADGVTEPCLMDGAVFKLEASSK